MRAPTALFVIAGLALAGGGYLFINAYNDTPVPAGLAAANGRIEVERVDISAKLPGRVAEIYVREGDLVQKGAIIARLDTAEISAQLAAAKALVQRAIAAVGRAQAEVTIREAELILAEVEMHRAAELAKRAAGTKAELDRRTAQYHVAVAQVQGANAAVTDAKAAVEVAEAQVTQIEAMLEDMVLRSPVKGRVEYRLIQAGEVVGSGGRLVTVLDLTEVFMTIFLPTSSAGRVALGSDARVVLDAAPNYVIPATVSFVAAEAQFTPKAVETSNEREKLMYRVKLTIDPRLLEIYRGYVKAGLTGNAFVKVSGGAVWPAHLASRLPDVPE